MTKVKNKNKLTEKYSEVINKYLSIIPPQSFSTWHTSLTGDHLSLAEKNSNYKDSHNDLQRLKKLFKEKTVELNNYAKGKGFDNFLLFIIDSNGISQKKYDTFINTNVDKFISLVVNEDIPFKDLNEKVEEWNKFNTPFPLGLQIFKDYYKTPEELMEIVSKYDRRVSKYQKDIEISLDSNTYYPHATFNKNTKKAEVRINKRHKKDILEVVTYLHELAHALKILETKDKGESFEKLSTYEKELDAYKFVHEFLKREIPEVRQKVIRYNELATLAGTLFEIDIFTNDKQDYDKAYARAVNRCYPVANQKKNPFYVLYRRFVLRPLGELVHNIIEAELYLDEAQTSPN